MSKEKDKKNASPNAEPAEEATETVDTAVPETSEESTPVETEADALKAELAAEKERFMRLAAEYDNFRKRSAKEREGLFNDVRSDTVAKILPVYDNLERALKQETTDTAFYRGVEMTMNQLNDIFTKLGVTPIEAVGQPFDPSVHNAVMHVEDETLGENMVVEEFQKGFKLGDKIIRFAMVKVAN